MCQIHICFGKTLQEKNSENLKKSLRYVIFGMYFYLRMAIMTGDSIEDSRFKHQRKYGCFALYVAYRLDPSGSISHQAKISQLRQSQLFTKGIPIENASGGDAGGDGVSPIDMAYVQVLFPKF